MDTLTPANYFEARDDCEMTCPIGAGLTGAGLRHRAACLIVRDTGHAYREAVAREAERLGATDPEQPRTQAYILLVGHYADEQVVGVHIAEDPADAVAVAHHMTLMRATATTTRRPPSDLIEVRAEPVALLDDNGHDITRSVRLEILP